MYHEGTVVDACFEYFVSSLLLALWMELVEYFYIIFYADDGFVDLQLQLLHILRTVCIQKLIYHCYVLLTLVLLKWNHTVVLPILFY